MPSSVITRWPNTSSPEETSQGGAVSTRGAPIDFLHAFGVGQWPATKPGVDLVVVTSGEHGAPHPRTPPVVHILFDHPGTQTQTQTQTQNLPALSRVDNDVSHPGDGHAVRDHSSAPDGRLRGHDALEVGVLDSLDDLLTTSALRPVRLASEPAQDHFDRESRLVNPRAVLAEVSVGEMQVYRRPRGGFCSGVIPWCRR